MKRQGLALGAGVVAMVVVLLVDYRRWRDFAIWLYLGTTLMLGARARRRPVDATAPQAWFDVGGFQLQPSEFAKVTLILMLASYLGAHVKPDGGLPFNRFVVALLLTFVPVGLTLAQPDLGTASVMIAVAMGVLLVAGARARHILVITAMALLTIGVLVGTGQLDQYQQDRLLNFIRNNSSISVASKTNTELENRLRESARQVDNSEAAISKGGLAGEGFLNGSHDQRRLRARAAHRLRVLGHRGAVRDHRHGRWSCCSTPYWASASTEPPSWPATCSAR